MEHHRNNRSLVWGATRRGDVDYGTGLNMLVEYGTNAAPIRENMYMHFDHLLLSLMSVSPDCSPSTASVLTAATRAIISNSKAGSLRVSIFESIESVRKEEPIILELGRKGCSPIMGSRLYSS